MDLMERTNEKRRNFMRDRLEHKLDDAMKDRIRLEQANDLLKRELDREQRDRDHMLSALEKGMKGMKPQRSRFRRLMVLGVGVGAAYVYGAKAGRGRYDELVSWWDRMRGRATELQTEAQRKVSEQADRMTGKMQGTSDMTESDLGEIGTSAMSSPTTSSRPSRSTSTSGMPTPSSGTPSSGTPSSGSQRSTQGTGPTRSSAKDATTGESR